MAGMETDERPVRYYVLPSTKGFRVVEMTDLQLVQAGLGPLLIDPPYDTREEAEAARLRLLGISN